MKNSTKHLVEIYTVANHLFLITIIPFGIISNIFCIIVFTRKRLRNTNMAFYNVLLASTNIVTLCFYALIQNSKLFYGYDVTIMFNYSCKMYFFARRVIREIPPMIECVLTIDRLLNFSTPSKIRFINRTNNIFRLKIILFICLILCLLSIENLFYNVEIKKSTDGSLQNGTRICAANNLILELSDLVSATLRTFIPFIIMFATNILLVKRVLALLDTYKLKKSFKMEYNFTLAVISLNGLFLFFNLPESICYIVKSVNLSMLHSEDLADLIDILFNICYIISTSYYAFLLVFSFVFNSLFRKESRKMIFDAYSYFCKEENL